MRRLITILFDCLEISSDLFFILYITFILLIGLHFCETSSARPKSFIKDQKGKNQRRSRSLSSDKMEVKLGGLSMNFPYTPYGIQKAMLAKIAVTLTNKEHSLIESPTGTGKTLVLLCASLAWQYESKANQTPLLSARLKKQLIEQRLEKLRNRPCSCGRRPNRSEMDELKEAKGAEKKCVDKEYDDIDLIKESVSKKMKTMGDDDGTSPYFRHSANGVKQKKKNAEPEFIVIDSDEDEPCKLEPLQEEKFGINVIKTDESHKSEKFRYDTNTKDLEKTTENLNSQDICKNCRAISVEDAFMAEMGEPSGKLTVGKVPRIYYGTRTHKQITQVVRELKKTRYRDDLKMCILSSRDRTCINDDVRDLADRNDKCQELVRNKSKSSNPKNKKDIGETCPFYKDSNSIAVEFDSIHEDYKHDAWDIEDAVSFGRKYNLCPYYGIRSIQEQADITFCPYNYLLDPNIRKALNINLSNAVVIFDEAHNIEDICRDSASFIINTAHIDDILNSINRAASNYMQGSTVRDAYDFYRNLFTDIKAFLIRYQFDDKDNQSDGDCIARHIMLHQEMLNELQRITLGSKILPTLKEHLKALRGEDDDSNDRNRGNSNHGDENNETALSNNEMQFITQLTNTLEFMYGRDGKYCSDYRMIVSKHLDRPKPGAWRNANRLPSKEDVYLYQLSLMCMNPGIAFEKIHSLAWSVIVASGTLAPIESLKTELGCNFSQVFEGSHVIGDDRIFAAVLSRGPNRVDLNCAYANSMKLEFQDEVGQIIRDVCQKVPNGVLCFFPSYDRMETLYQRWFTKGFMKEIERSGKKLFREQKNFTAAKFEEELAKYHKNAKGRGALLFAVFRGKVSEGIDFSDTAARAVITIGIPYPNVREVTVALKRDYNDIARREKPFLMSGSDWYSAQAFRALNQALGRCIRHKDDWGAILMIDSRLQGSNVNNISKWIRRVVKAPNDYRYARDTLDDFVQLRLTDPSPIEKVESLGASISIE